MGIGDAQRTLFTVRRVRYPMNDARDETEPAVLSMTAMRAEASWFIDQPALLRHQTVKGFHHGFRAYLERLIPQIEQLTEGLPEDDVPAKVALAGVGAARRRLGEPESAGLNGEVERVKRLARSVMALCDHCDALTGLMMCLACDQPIEATDAWTPYDVASPFGGGAKPGRIHDRCANAGRSAATSAQLKSGTMCQVSQATPSLSRSRWEA